MGLTAGFPFADWLLTRSNTSPNIDDQAADHNKAADLITKLKLELVALELAVDLRTYLTVNDAASSPAATVRLVAYTAITAARISTLPLSSTCVAGRPLTIVDFSGSANGTKTITAARSGTDLIEGGTSHIAVNVAYGSRTYVPDGVSKWVAIG